MEQALADIIVAQYGTGILILVILLVAFWKLFTELRKVREEAAYQLNFDLISKRAAAYAGLWSKMRPLAIYSNASFDTASAKELGDDLSGWYFSEMGGLFLTYRARDFYFALQFFLQSIADIPGWVCMQRPHETRSQFIALLREIIQQFDHIGEVVNKHADEEPDQIDATKRNDVAGQNDEIRHIVRILTGEELDRVGAKKLKELTRQCNAIRHVIKKLEEKSPSEIDSKKWSSACESISRYLLMSVDSTKTDAGDRVFVSAQQISSILRSNLAHEVHSRLSVDWPETRISLGKGGA